MQTKKNLGIRATVQRWRQLNRIRLQNELSMQQLVDQALDAHWLGSIESGERTVAAPQGRLLLERAVDVLADAVRYLEGECEVVVEERVKILVSKRVV